MYEQAYSDLLALIAPTVGGCGGQVGKTEDALLYALAKKHGIVNLLAYAWQGREDIAPEWRAAVERSLFTTVRQQAEQDRERAAVTAELRRAGIRFLPMKGVFMRALYPAPEMRSSCDIDIFYDSTHRARVEEILTARGYTCALRDPNHDEYEKPPYVAVEMHHNLLTDFPTVDAYYRDVWERLIPVGEGEYRMSDEDFYIYQTVHTMKHFSKAGTGIRSVLDVFVYLRAKPDLDRSYIERELDTLGLLPFAKTLEKLANVWFAGEEMPADLSEVAAYILGSGVYGVGINLAANRTPTGRGGKLRYALTRAFPPYRLMKEKYPSLRRAPVLLPFYWGMRLVRTLFRGNGRMGQEMRAIRAADESHIAHTRAVMDRVGLRDYR